MLAEATLMRRLEPSSVDGTVEPHHCVDTAVRTDCRQPRRLAVSPFLDRDWRELRETVKASGDVAGE